MARQYIINGQKFSTQKELKQYVRQILYKYRLRENLSVDDLEFMKDLLMGHENAEKKIGCGIQSMHIRENKPFNNRGFWIIRKIFGVNPYLLTDSQMRMLKIWKEL